jgi:hypothetical protein
MARALSILLIAVHLMNIIGCYGIFAGLESSYQDKISDKLNADEFAGSQAITLRVPFNLPYANFPRNYERVQGKIEYEGEVYQLVKQKFYNDTLFIVCFRDAKLNEIKDAFRNYTAAMGADTSSDGKQSSRIVNFLLKDFEPTTTVKIDVDLFLVGLFRAPGYFFSEKTNPEFLVDQPPKV